MFLQILWGSVQVIGQLVRQDRSLASRTCGADLRLQQGANKGAKTKSKCQQIAVLVQCLYNKVKADPAFNRARLLDSFRSLLVKAELPDANLPVSRPQFWSRHRGLRPAYTFLAMGLVELLVPSQQLYRVVVNDAGSRVSYRAVQDGNIRTKVLPIQ